MCRFGAVPTANDIARRAVASVCFLSVCLLLGVAWCGDAFAGQSSATTSPKASVHARSKPLSVPKTTFAQDTKFFTDVTEADPALVAYEQQQGNVALRALLTDGAAFCALLRRGSGIDDALVAEADGARGTESQTHLPLSITTFNTIEAVALLTLCPSEQTLVPASDRSKIRDLGRALGKRAG